MPLVTAVVAVCVASGKDVPVVVNWNIKPMFALVGMLKILLDTSVPLSTLPEVKKLPCASPSVVVPLRLMKSIRLVEFAIDMYFALASTVPSVALMNDFAPVVGEVNGLFVSDTRNTRSEE